MLVAVLAFVYAVSMWRQDIPLDWVRGVPPAASTPTVTAGFICPPDTGP
jgi:hypothetical protein